MTKTHVIVTPSSRWWGAILLAASACFIAYGQSKLSADLDPQSRARLPYLKKSDLDAKSQKSLEPFVAKDDIRAWASRLRSL